MELFPTVPEDLEAVEPDELKGLLDEFKTIGASLAADMQKPAEERELIPADATPADLTAALKDAAADKARIEEALSVRAEAEATFTAEFNEGLAALGVETEAPEALATAEADDDKEDETTDPDPDEAAAADEAAADTAASSASAEVEVEVETPAEQPAPRMAIPRGPSSLAPKPSASTASGTQVVATRGLESISVREGRPVEDFGQFAELAIKLAKRLGPPKHVRGGGEERHLIAAAQYDFPEEFVLSDSKALNLEKLRHVAYNWLGNPTEIEVFQAAGGICAPPTPFYDVPGFASRARPVRGALPSYNAVRGGVSVPSVNLVDRTDSGVTIIEESDDAQGGTFSVKSCRALECATWEDTFIGIISHCLEVGNLNARTWPEGVALEEDNLMAGWASAAETRLLNRIKSLSQPTSTAHVYNAVHDFIYAIARAKAAIRYRLRAELDASFTALIPEWIREELVADLAGQSGNEDRYVGVAGVERYLERLGVNVVWVKDVPTDVDAPFDSEGIDNFPVEVEWAMFLNGTFLHLDGGSLELGLVRDSSLNETNDYQLFGESFENVARIGPEEAALWITSTVCPSGQFPDAASALTCA